MPRAVLVVPCYNEEQRLRPEAFASFSREVADVDLLFVDDASTDGTAIVLAAICAESGRRASWLQLRENSGKGEAVRQGALAALKGGASFVGYWDADLATPLESVSLFLEEFHQRPQLEMVFGSRVRLLGRTIERRALRHYTGRCFATAVSLILRLPVYDTQCGAKLLRATPTLQTIFAAPFLSRWVFDVEILARLTIERRKHGGAPPIDCVAELPLPAWRDVKGSKVRLRDLHHVALHLWRVHRLLQRERAFEPPPQPS